MRMMLVRPGAVEKTGPGVDGTNWGRILIVGAPNWARSYGPGLMCHSNVSIVSELEARSQPFGP